MHEFVVIGVSKVKVRGAWNTKRHGRRYYKGTKRHWFVFGYDGRGRFTKRSISSASVPIWKARIKRRLVHFCEDCRKRFTGIGSIQGCPYCGSFELKRVKKGRPLTLS